MKRKLYLLLIILLSKSAYSQPSELRGMYIDNFSTVLGNISKEDSLLHYAQDSLFNYLALYDLHNLNLNNANTANMLSVFIKRARENFGIQYVGAIGETSSSFIDRIARLTATDRMILKSLMFSI